MLNMLVCSMDGLGGSEKDEVNGLGGGSLGRLGGLEGERMDRGRLGGRERKMII